MLTKAGLREVGFKFGFSEIGFQSRMDFSFVVLYCLLELRQSFMANRIISSRATVKKLALFLHYPNDFVFGHGKGFVKEDLLALDFR